MDFMSILPFIVAFFLVLISYLLFRRDENKEYQEIEEEMQEWHDTNVLNQIKSGSEKQIDDHSQYN